uniref:Ribosomal RNA processing 7 homolog A n=1 Tax=Cynoglossus semilaevis TaxID=244447 RepID=A0A3P8VD88_CYNSE
MASSEKKHAKANAYIIPGGFTVLSLRFDSDSVAQHNLYVKEHKVRAEKSSHRPLDRTLFVLNIPPYCSEAVVKELFSQFGCVQSVELKDHPGSSEESGPKLSKFFKQAENKGFKVGYIVFKKPSSVNAAKSHPVDVPLIVSTEEHPVKTGVQSDTEILLSSQTICSKSVKKRQEEEQQSKEAEQQQEDEDGWVKVTRGNKATKARPHTEAANQRTLHRELKKREKKELLNFYTWQHKNTQKEHIAELRKKFEEDKQRIALLRAQRKFKPY